MGLAQPAFELSGFTDQARLEQDTEQAQLGQEDWLILLFARHLQCLSAGFLSGGQVTLPEQREAAEAQNGGSRVLAGVTEGYRQTLLRDRVDCVVASAPQQIHHACELDTSGQGVAAEKVLGIQPGFDHGTNFVDTGPPGVAELLPGEAGAAHNCELGTIDSQPVKQLFETIETPEPGVVGGETQSELELEPELDQRRIQPVDDAPQHIHDLGFERRRAAQGAAAGVPPPGRAVQALHPRA